MSNFPCPPPRPPKKNHPKNWARSPRKGLRHGKAEHHSLFLMIWWPCLLPGAV